VTTRRAFIRTLAGGLLAAPLGAEAQQVGKRYRVGVVREGGPFYAMIDGLKGGLKELGLDEGAQYILHIRDVKGDPKALEETARALEQEKVDLIYSLATSVTHARKGPIKFTLRIAIQSSAVSSSYTGAPPPIPALA